MRTAAERKVPRRVEVLVELGRLSAEDGRTIQELRQLDQDVGSEEPEAGGAGALELLPPAEQRALNTKIQGAIEYEVGYLDISTSLQRIGTDYDDALTFLRHDEGLDVYRNEVTGREVYLGRTSPKPA